MTTMLMNGKPPRKLLSDQLDRFDAQMDRQDSILDALSAGLNEAVADAAKEGVKEAVTSAVIELLTNIDLRVALHKATAPETDARPTFWQRVKTKVGEVTTRVQVRATRVVAAVTARVTAVQTVVHETSARLGLAWQLRKVVMIGLGVGLVVAAFSYVGPHGFSAVLSGAGAAATAVAVQVRIWVRRTIRRLARQFDELR